MKEGGGGEGGEGGWTEGRTFIIIHVLILNILEILCTIFPGFNARLCFNEFFKLLYDTWIIKVIIIIIIIIIVIFHDYYYYYYL